MLISGPGPSRLTGEIGRLTRIRISDLPSTRRCFLHMQHEQSSYIGCLLFDEAAFCQQITEILQSCCNRPIAEIGSIDLAHIL
jgi:hypothetical protein